MADFAIPVDLRNAGHVFACLGFAEAAQAILKTDCQSRFDYTGYETASRFVLSIDGSTNPFAATITFLREAQASTLIPSGTGSDAKLSTKKWDVPEEKTEGSTSPNPVPGTPATLPVVLDNGKTRFVLDHWADGTHCGRDNVKFWAGSGGYPGSALTRDVLTLIKDIPDSAVASYVLDPFSFAAPMTSSFRFDWRRDYIPLDAGFSPNSHGNLEMVGYPFTEILAIIGLQYARPTRIKKRDNKRDKLNYRYGVSSATLPVSLSRIILGAVNIGFPMRIFHLSLGWPGKVGQARCITDSREEIYVD
jgi:CRISPR-associated protein Csb3